MQNCNKLIPAVTANKILCRYAFAQLNRKIADIFIAFIMANGIVDGTQIIQVKYTDCGLFHFSSGSVRSSSSSHLFLLGRPVALSR